MSDYEGRHTRQEYEARHLNPARSDGQDGQDRTWDGWATGNTNDAERGRWLYEGARS